MAEEAVWSVKAFQCDGASRLSVQSSLLYVDFAEKEAWTIRNIKYLGDQIVGEAGANGSVVNVKHKAGMDAGGWIGTGHGMEMVKRFSVFVDGIEKQCAPGAAFSGRQIVIRKESNLGPLDHKAEITFPASGDFLIERHSYTVVEDLNERFNYVYAFMHCNNNALNYWLALLDKGEELEQKVDKDDNVFGLQRDVKAVIFHGETLKKGVVYVYPEIYQGADTFKNSVWDRKNDNKLYFRPEVKGKYKAGDTFEYLLRVIPFSAEPGTWREKGKNLAAKNWTMSERK